MEINSPNCQEMNWIREMLRQCMAVARQTTDTYIEVVFQSRHIFFIRHGTRTGFLLVKKKRTENRFSVPMRAVNRVPVQILAAQC